MGTYYSYTSFLNSGLINAIMNLKIAHYYNDKINVGRDDSQSDYFIIYGISNEYLYNCIHKVLSEGNFTFGQYGERCFVSPGYISYYYSNDRDNARRPTRAYCLNKNSLEFRLSLISVISRFYDDELLRSGWNSNENQIGLLRDKFFSDFKVVFTDEKQNELIWKNEFESTTVSVELVSKIDNMSLFKEVLNFYTSETLESYNLLPFINEYFLNKLVLNKLI